MLNDASWPQTEAAQSTKKDCWISLREIFPEKVPKSSDEEAIGDIKASLKKISGKKSLAGGKEEPKAAASNSQSGYSHAATAQKVGIFADDRGAANTPAPKHSHKKKRKEKSSSHLKIGSDHS